MTEFSTAPLRILFLCTHNSSRSQMAEGLLRAQFLLSQPFPSYEQMYAVAQAQEEPQ